MRLCMAQSCSPVCFKREHSSLIACFPTQIPILLLSSQPTGQPTSNRHTNAGVSSTWVKCLPVYHPQLLFPILRSCAAMLTSVAACQLADLVSLAGLAPPARPPLTPLDSDPLTLTL